MKFGHLELFVRNPQLSREFYSHFGFELVADQGSDFTWIKSGDAEFLLRKHDVRHDAPYGSTGPAIVLYTSDLPAAMRALSEKGLTPAACDRGEECCPLYRDPDGNWIQLVDPSV